VPLLPISVRSLPSSNRIASSRLFPNFHTRLNSSPPPSPSPPSPEQKPDATLSQRLKHLIKSYGWYALGVYFTISAIDFGVAFAGINLLGAEKVSRVAVSAKESFASIVHSKPPEPGREQMEAPGGGGGHEGLYAMLVLAYTVHKTVFLPVRVGLTAALTPKLVGWLRTRGWSGGDGARRAATELKDRLRNRD
jgi:hypothetical protein